MRSNASAFNVSVMPVASAASKVCADFSWKASNCSVSWHHAGRSVRDRAFFHDSRPAIGSAVFMKSRTSSSQRNRATRRAPRSRSASLAPSWRAAVINSRSVAKCAAVLLCGPRKPRKSDASAVNLARTRFAASTREASAPPTSASSMASVKLLTSARPCSSSCKSVSDLPMMSSTDNVTSSDDRSAAASLSPSSISDTSLTIWLSHLRRNLQHTGTPSALSRATAMASISLAYNASSMERSASLTLASMALLHVRGRVFCSEDGVAYTNRWTTASLQKTSCVSKQRYLKSVDMNSLPVAAQAFASITFFKRRRDSGSVQMSNAVCDRSFLALTSTPCDKTHSTTSGLPPAAAWCNTVFPRGSLACKGSPRQMRIHNADKCLLNAAQCIGECLLAVASLV
mmetsp:Transcript_109163/g.307806  ORF Transcript_109163/g.307806 Transcript_109163/m.307806 type:complete len:400 (-) Transcript_109163:96-1295(-)